MCFAGTRARHSPMIPVGANCNVETWMNTLVKTFLRGLLAFLPIFLTLYAVYFFGAWLNRITTVALTIVWPDAVAIPGLGIGFGIVAVFILGMLVSSRLTRWIYQLVEIPLQRAPMIRELYGAFKQLTAFVSPQRGQRAGVVVSVAHPAHDVAMIGLLMRDDIRDIGLGETAGDHVAVYLPMSYQIGGFTVFVPRAWVSRIDMPVETALRETLTGWISTDEGAARAPAAATGAGRGAG